jgi:UDP-glucose 4-epimerase
MENISLRISNPYGFGQNPQSGVGLITTVTYRIINGQNIIVYGDGQSIRDYIDIESVARAFYEALCWEFDKKMVPIFNIGSGQELSINDILTLVQEALDVEANITYMPKRAFDVSYSCLDVTKMSQVFNLEAGDQSDKIKNYVLGLKKSGGKI